MSAEAAEKFCGSCCKFSAESGVGECSVLRRGSDIAADPPVFVLRGSMKFVTEPRADASKCTHFEGKSPFSLSC